jgi:hypothetical protein
MYHAAGSAFVIRLEEAWVEWRRRHLRILIAPLAA